MMNDKEMFIKIAKKYGAKENDGQGLRVVMPNGEIKPLTEEIMREIIFPFIPDLNVPFVTGMSTDADKPIPESETWSNDQKPIKIKYGEKNLIKRNCAHCSDSVDYTFAGCEVLYACPLPKCKFEEDNKITVEIIGEKNECKNS